MQKLEVKRYLDGKEKKEIPGGTGKFSLGVQNEAGQRLKSSAPRECTDHSKHPLPKIDTTLHMDITRWSAQKSD